MEGVIVVRVKAEAVSKKYYFPDRRCCEDALDGREGDVAGTGRDERWRDAADSAGRAGYCTGIGLLRTSDSSARAM